MVGLVGSYHAKRVAHQLERHSAERIQADILALDQLLQQQLTEISQKDIGLQTLCNKWDEKGIGFVVYNRNRIADWTTNGIPFPVEFDSRQPPKQGVVKLKGAWYLSRSLKSGNQLLVAYALLRTNYDFENRYIANRWGPSIQADTRFTLSQVNVQVPIQLTDGASSIGIRLLSDTKSTAFSVNAAIWFTFLLLLLASLWQAGKWLATFTTPKVATAVFVVSVISLRALLLWLEVPRALYELELFGPTLHATSEFIPSLGDFILHLTFLLLIVLYVAQTPLQVKNKRWQQVVAVGIPVLLLWPIHELFEILVVNSAFSLNLNNPFSLDVYSFIGLFASFLILLNYHVLFRWLYQVLNPKSAKVAQIAVPLLVSIAVLIVCLDVTVHGVLVGLVAGVILFFLMLMQHWIKDKSGVYKHAPNVLAFSLLATVMLLGEEAENEKELRVGIARKIYQQQDPITEFLFEDLAQDIHSDRKLRLQLTSLPIDAQAVLKRLHEKLAYDHWNRYQSLIDVFNSDGGVMVSDQEVTGPNYTELQSDFEKSRPTVSNGLRYVGNWSTDGGYLARIALEGKRNQQNLVLFIRFTPEKTDDILGFTDLFVSEEISTAKKYEGYSYALYKNNELQEEHGEFSYSLSAQSYAKYTDKNTFFTQDGYHHLVSRTQEDALVVVSRKQIGLLGYLTTFSYLFFLYLLCFGVASLISGQLVAGLKGKGSFRNRIHLAMSTVSFVSLVLIGFLTVYYVVREYHSRNREMISEKSRSILIELEHKLQDYQGLSEEDKPKLTALLVKFSKVFFTDINLYHVDGRLLATSRPRLFDDGLMAEVIDPTAYVEMRFGQKSSFIQEETIGNLSYLTAYIPFRNKHREVVAFLSLPYFARQYGLQQEIFSLLAALTNIYVFLILISVVLALVVSNRITEPLLFIRESLKNLKLDETNRAIEWNSNDEIGDLVNEYNQTLNELARSAEMLARSERESAWREMAKQVAHEIKNPLTPMKLSIQMLQRSKNDGVEDLAERIDRTTQTLTEQIDTLSNIATEFSSFAQMPKSTIEQVNLEKLLENVAELHHNSHVKIILDIKAIEPSLVLADKEQMLRVLNNLIKNGIQAVTDGVQPVIKLGLTATEQKWIVSVHDNGEGVSDELRDKIFAPNFTTKSSGMGLGLAMVKNIVESVNGNIWFNSDEQQGTTFFVALPKMKTLD